jgi:hypothetical protein
MAPLPRGGLCPKIYGLLSRREPSKALSHALGVAVLTAGLAVAWSCRSGASVSDLARVEVWKAAWSAFLQRPWLGWGPDGFEDAFKLLRSDVFVSLLGSTRHQAYPHNDLLHVLSSTGIIGAAAYTWFLTALVLSGRRALARRGRRLAASLFAGLLALWVNLFLNPVAQEVLVLAAVCAGLLVSASSDEEFGVFSWRPLNVLVALALVSLAYAGGLARADFTCARRGSPCELAYITGEINAVGEWINATHVVQERLDLLALADKDACQGLSCHPRQSRAHYAAASAARMHFELGFNARLPDVMRELDAAIRLDPKFGPLLAARSAAALLKP